MASYVDAKKGEIVKLYPLDIDGTNDFNYIKDEIHTTVYHHDSTGHFIVPKCSPYHLKDFKVYLRGHQSKERVELKEKIDFEHTLAYRGASENIGSLVYGAIEIKNPNFAGVIELEYRTIGGDQILNTDEILRDIVEGVFNPRVSHWDFVANARCLWPPKRHDHNAEDTTDYQDLVAAIHSLAENMAKGNGEVVNQLKAHLDKYDPCKFEYMFNALSDHSFIEIVNRMNLLEEKQRELLSVLMFEKYMDMIDAMDKYSWGELIARMDKVEDEFEELKRALDVDKMLEILDAMENVDLQGMGTRIDKLETNEKIVAKTLKDHEAQLTALGGVTGLELKRIGMVLDALVDHHCDVMNGFMGSVVTMVELDKLREEAKTNKKTARDVDDILSRIDALEKKK